MQLWLRIVREYTGMNLTMDHDGLPALSAIAREFQNHQPDQKYLAGMWYDAFFGQQLLWCVRAVDSPLGRPSNWCPPTWSWASTQAKNIQGMRSLGVPLVFTVLDATCQYLDESNPLGTVIGGSLTIRGELLAASISVDGKPMGNPPITYYKIRHEEHRLKFILDTSLGPADEYGCPFNWGQNKVALLAGTMGQPCPGDPPNLIPPTFMKSIAFA